MKQNRKLLSIIMVLFMITAIPQKAEAKFWGNETTSSWVGTSGGCMYQYTTECYYVFWINTGCSTTATLVACDEDGPDPCYPSPCPDN